MRSIYSLLLENKRKGKFRFFLSLKLVLLGRNSNPHFFVLIIYGIYNYLERLFLRWRWFLRIFYAASVITRENYFFYGNYSVTLAENTFFSGKWREYFFVYIVQIFQYFYFFLQCCFLLVRRKTTMVDRYEKLKIKFAVVADIKQW